MLTVPIGTRVGTGISEWLLVDYKAAYGMVNVPQVSCWSLYFPLPSLRRSTGKQILGPVLDPRPSVWWLWIFPMPVSLTGNLPRRDENISDANQYFAWCTYGETGCNGFPVHFTRGGAWFWRIKPIIYILVSLSGYRRAPRQLQRLN